MTQDRLEELMVKRVDGLATAAERQELMAHLAGHPDLQRELDAHLALKATTDGWVDRLQLDGVLDHYAQRSDVRVERGIGISLLIGGTAVLSGFGLMEFLLDGAAPLWAKLGTAGVVAGGAVLLISVVRWRLATRKNDKYSEVIR